MSKLLPFISLVTLLISYQSLFSQQTYNSKKIIFEKYAVVSPRQIKKDWLFELQNLDNSFEGNEAYWEFFKSQKQIVNHKYHSKEIINIDSQVYDYYSVDTPKVSYAFEANRYSASIPNDNTLAVSNDGIVVSAINSNIIFYDTKEDSLLKTISLSAFSDTLSMVSKHQYDPKAIYDYKSDRFILVFLAGSGQSTTTNIIVAFSSSSNPLDEWNVYSLPGNPLNDTSWSDYPAISLSNDELFITVNLLKKGGGSWQTSFKQSVIWQIDKSKAYNGDSLQTALYSEIGLNGIPVRNIHPIRGGNRFYGPDMYFMSERNFDIKNDTFFLIHTFNTLESTSLELSINALLSDMPYGMPPNARQTNNKFLATNDSRVLGGFYQNEFIQFVGNCVDTTTGHASFYHGVFNPKRINERIHLNVLSDTLLEFGYPNISYCGTNNESMHSIISFNYTSAKVYPGVGAIFYEGRNSDAKDLYSPPIVLKKGDTPIRVLVSTQRWGDYSGSQPRYNKVGEVWTVGTFGKKIGITRGYGTWIASIHSSVNDIPIVPDDESIILNIYPNPSTNGNVVKVDFVLKKTENIKIQIFDISGKQISNIYQGNAFKGRNVLSFSTLPLSSGMYFIVIKNSKIVLKTQKFSVL